MDTIYSIEAINDEVEEAVEATGATQVHHFFSGLSLVDKIKKAEESILSSKIVKKIKKGYKSLTQKFKKSKLAQKLAIYGLVGAMTIGTGVGCSSAKKSASNDTISTSISQETNDEDLIPKDSEFNVILNASKSETQKEVLSSVGNFLADYNMRFAAPIADTVKLINSETNEEKNITIKPALTWDEAMAMSLVYNDFSKAELLEILNGSDINANKLNNAYKMAMLQLMGAHVLETSENPVKVDMLLQNKEAQQFYEKYHKMFLKCKETTGDERLEAVKKFYEEVNKDFPITAEIREDGIMHSDPRESIESYKFSVVPMISAAEIMFQNLDVDYTLTQEEVDYLNDIGACQIAEDILERASYVSLAALVNPDNADYDAVKDAMITFLKNKDAYVIDDIHRDLSKLPLFQEIVNGFILEPYTYTYTTTYTVTQKYTVTETTTTDDRDEAVDLAGEEAVSDAEQKAQEELDRENQEAKEEAEKEADKKAEEIQEEEDKKKEDLQDKVDEDNKNYQEKIDDANEKIDNGGSVNEDDLGNGTNFDNDHSDSNGNLDDSVKDITTDGSGAVDSSTPLPDPNIETATAYAFTIEPIYEEPKKNEPVQQEPKEVYEYEEDSYAFSNDAEIDAYIEFQAAYSDIGAQEAYQYHL